ncbi:PH domain-containing protein [Staphylococcus caprae]|nr:PH domain-containing protein [Staphylococcus caprae]MDK6298851.1 PH domain-containing protein [Staphylococcus caprae]SUL95084.1 membrane protein [Staphylococcus caprae]
MIAAIAIIHFIFSPFIRYKYHFYKFEGNSIILKEAFFFKREELSKIERLQFITIGTNPLAKKFKINSIELVTAGHEITLPMISEQEAQMIQQQALDRLRGVNDDV